MFESSLDGDNNIGAGEGDLRPSKATDQITTKIHAQTRVAGDAAADIRRKVGDFSLYGNDPNSAFSSEMMMG